MVQIKIKTNEYGALTPLEVVQPLVQKQRKAVQEIVQTYIEFEEVDKKQGVLSTTKAILTSIASIVSHGLTMMESATARKANKATRNRKYKSLRSLSKQEDNYLSTFPDFPSKVSSKSSQTIIVNGNATFTINN